LKSKSEICVVSIGNKLTRYKALDGVRGISILLVLSAHLLPLGPKVWGLNQAVGVVGMGLFFALSGFLVTTQLAEGMTTKEFALKRVARILPLAWPYMAIALVYDQADKETAIYLFTFLTTLVTEPTRLTPSTAHLWSLCVEMQFYVLAGALMHFWGKRGLKIIPALCIAVTLWRVFNGTHGSSSTLLRADEILAGAWLGLLWQAPPEQRPSATKLLNYRNTYIYLILYIISSWSEIGGALCYVRPYFLLMLVGSLISNPNENSSHWLHGPKLTYVASISYALYVIHQILSHTWLGSGDTTTRYLKRPLLLLILFGLAHVSSFHYEKIWTDRVRKFLKKPLTNSEGRP